MSLYSNNSNQLCLRHDENCVLVIAVTLDVK